MLIVRCEVYFTKDEVCGDEPDWRDLSTKEVFRRLAQHNWREEGELSLVVGPAEDEK